MNISPITTNTATQRGKRIGTAAGAGVTAGYIAKNAKPLFMDRIPNEAIKLGLSKTAGYAASGIAAGVIAAGIIGAGRLIGGCIGKIVDVCNAKKEEKEIQQLKNQVSEKYPDGIPFCAPVSPEKMKKMMNDKEYLKELLSY